MKEVRFLKENKDKWEEFESMIDSKETPDPDQLAGLYIQTMDDLSYARTFYPSSKTTRYLNQLSAKIHRIIYRNKKEDSSRLKKFILIELPLILARSRREIIISFIVTLFGVFIGGMSTAFDDGFVRLIMGDAYVNMTIENIKNNDPMAVYKKANEIEMFLGITLNNVRVSFYAFAFGVFFSVGAGYILFSNGVMLGAFFYFFIQRGLFYESFRTVWIHGALEISAIVIAGAAGMVIGNSILFPGTFKRRDSFRFGAKNGVKIVFGLIPIFIVAGFLEGFVTRHTEMSDWIAFPIIISSFAFMIYYFIIYPYNLQRKQDGTSSKN